MRILKWQRRQTVAVEIVEVEEEPMRSFPDKTLLFGVVLCRHGCRRARFLRNSVFVPQTWRPRKGRFYAVIQELLLLETFVIWTRIFAIGPDVPPP